MTETREWVVLENKGQKIFGILHLPIREQVLPPVVVTLHGFASSKHVSNRSYVTLAENFAKNGIATLRFDFRGSGDSEGSLSEISFEDLISDALAAYRFLDQLESVDRERIGIFGSSLGGAIAALTAEKYQKAKAMVLWAPVATGELWYRDFIKQNPEMAKKDPREALGTYRGMQLSPLFREQFGKMQAAKAIERLPHLPILHFQGDSDSTISLEHQKLYQHFGAKHSAEKRFITLPNTGHFLGHTTILPSIIQESVQWFKKHL